YKSGKKIKEGVTVALCGKPNTGKSSLLNALLGYEKAIVSAEAGTTRDAVEGTLELDGVTYNLIDTAGIRERAGNVESIGIDRARKIIETADVILSVSEGEEVALPSNTGGKIIKVFNKSDIKTHVLE
ncbi:MAG: 50S ribosome-binding GTPase, partial [Clostridia bacterium]|nr:50S ribosome-binding GTPase [Clostridia bacterium]